ncbi:lactate dehydrogenase B [Dichotomocladium elegans]|nr:lactate dehydrogenase B [Dichotomocladium elegans]
MGRQWYSNDTISRKVSIIGAGGVGSTVASMIMTRNCCEEILMVDAQQEFLCGQVLDLSDANIDNSTKVRSASWKEAGQADVIVITAGAKQKTGESREQARSVVLVVSNPVDILTCLAQNISGLPKSRVFGSGTFLDSSRLNVYLSNKLKVASSSIHAYVLGEHGDSQFIAWDSASVAGRPLLSFPEIQKVDKNVIRNAISDKAMEIIRYKGSTFYGIGACASSLVASVLHNTMVVRPVSVYVDEFDTVLSMPAKIGARGIEEVFEIPLSDHEKEELRRSAQTVKSVVRRYERSP